MGPDLDSSELVDAVGKKRTAKTCRYGGSSEEREVIGERSADAEAGEPRRESGVSEHGGDHDFKE